MRDPNHGETAGASLSRFQTTKAGNTIVGSSKSTDKNDRVPTYPLQNLREMDESQIGLEKFDADDKKSAIHGAGLGNDTRDFGNTSMEREPQVYEGVLIQSQVR